MSGAVLPTAGVGAGLGAAVRVFPPAVLAAVPSPAPAAGRAAPRSRTRLWELNGSIHCSVIGTCLTTGELRSTMVKVLGRSGVEDATDHDLHARAVGLCGGGTPCAKLLHKALDRRYAAVINRFARLTGEEAVMALWAEFRRAGDIPGAYWAVLTHPDTGHAGLRRAFGDVHMLSHLVGSANRADVRRLAALEEENALLQRKVERQQERLRDAALAAPAPCPALPAPGREGAPDAGLAALTRQLDEARTRLAAEAARRERAEERLARAQAAQKAAADRAETVEAEAAALRRELGLMEAAEPGALPERIPPERVLYVGGRPGTLGQVRALLTEAGGELLLHDGGRHDNPSLLPGLISRADRVVFPVDCVSHDAALAVKRLCGAGGKPWVPLRSAGLSSFLACMAAPEA